MVDITKELEDALHAARRTNYYEMPPAQLPGIGQWQSALAPAMFAGLSADDVVVPQPLGPTPEKLTGFDQIVPVRVSPEGMIPDADSDHIYALQAGVYLIVGFVNADVAVGGSYAIEVYANDQPTGIVFAQDLSNQSGFLSFVLSSYIKLERGDFVSLYGSSAAPASQFDLLNSLFFLTRIR